MAAYYNEIDPHAAAWLRELIAGGFIADGEVDERSILDVFPADLKGFTQHHFFAGIGGWSLALRLAGWPDDRPVWTGSCPCQPFSSAGKGAGFDDERHLWPAFHWLVNWLRPPVVFGEQVASPDGLKWLDLVRSDLEGSGYAFGAADLCAAGFGAPHIRQRLYWCGVAPGGVADVHGAGCSSGRQRLSTLGHGQASRADGGASLRVADTERHRGRGEVAPSDHVGAQADGSTDQCGGHSCASLRVDNTHLAGLEGLRGGHQASGVSDGYAVAQVGPTAEAGESLWSVADWLPCRDGKSRPVEPGTFPLAHGLPSRVVRLRGYGNAIVPQVAAGFIKAVMA